MKVVFLDFDGPIIPIMSHQVVRLSDARERAWPECIAQLNRITDSTGAKIVVSSTWRWGGEDYVRDLLKEWGATGQVIGITPVSATKGKRVWYSQERGQEIGVWLLQNKDVDSFVILDDDDDMGSFKSRLIQIPMETGLTERLADHAIAMLKLRNDDYEHYT